jgi:predicted AAA+ superfamily ATPase
MIKRQAEILARTLARGFPIVAFTGPRQSGKTTLARELFSDRAYVTLEDPVEKDYALRDPRGFFARFSDGAVIDEAQRCPELFSYLQGLVDTRRRMGDFILTGSQQFGLRSGISQSLAGRVGLVQLLPFSLNELKEAQKLPTSLDAALWLGGYPPLFDRELPPHLWFSNYVSTYVERDVRQLLAVRDLDLFQRFVKLCAARTGQLLNLSALAADCGISHTAAREWLSVLETSYLVMRLPPYFKNFGKRLVKAPKLYFLDVGLAVWLLGIRDTETLNTHAMRGALFETWVVSELVKQRFNAGQPLDLHFWRDNVGHEVDVVFESQGRQQCIEIKSGATFVADWLAAARKWTSFAGDSALPPWIVYGGEDSYVREGARVIGWRDADTLQAL